MLTLRKIAVTGTLSSGKSSVCKILQSLGAYVLSADDIVHDYLSPHTDIGQQVIALLGLDIMVGDQMSRSKIAEKVFTNQTLRQSLENLLHPEVQRMIQKEYARIASHSRYPCFVVEIPLLLEKGWHKDFDLVLCVDADEGVCYQRYHAKTGRSREDYDHRRALQLSREEKKRRADLVIENNGSIKELEEAVQQMFPRLCGEKAKDGPFP